MAETGRSLGADTGSREDQAAPTQAPRSSADRIEMDNLSPTTKAAATSSSSPNREMYPAPTLSGDAPIFQFEPSQIPVPAKDETAAQASSSGASGAAAATTDAEGPQPPSTQALGKAPGKAPAAPAAGTVPEQDSMEIQEADPDDTAGPDGELCVRIELLSTSSSTRHPFNINEKYLTKRNVSITGKTDNGHPDPFSITVYTLKELILREWRKEWEIPPREPVSIRLIYFGKLLEDRQSLSSYNFSRVQKNVVHMTVKPQDIVDEEEANKKVKDSSSQGGRSSCCVIL